MNKYKLQIEILSDTLIGSGEGFGAVIDTDIVFDEIGIPFIPSKRIKGLLREYAGNAIEMFKSFELDLPKNESELFGKPGLENYSDLLISDLYIEDYDNNFKWMECFTKSEKFEELFSKDSVMDNFTNIRKSTTIDDSGVAKKNSLRSVRVLSKGYRFYGDIVVESGNEEFEKLLVLACINLKAMGTKRNRGLGEIKCILYKDSVNLNEIIIKELEEICKD